MATTDETYKDAERRMKKAIEALHGELRSIRTGRANPALVEHISVDYYGTPVPLNQIAAVSAPEARLLVIEPWDKGAFPAIEKGLLKSELGLTPSSDGSVIRLTIPILTEERRRNLAKMVDRKLEEGKVAVRNIRRDALEHLRKMEKEKEVSQDEERRGQERLQKMTDKMIVEMEDLCKQKKAEILEV